MTLATFNVLFLETLIFHPPQHDLQAAISAAQAAVTTGEAVQLYIPTPDASRTINGDDYPGLYKKSFNQPTTFIKYSTTVEDSVGCLYDMDEEDDTWLTCYNQQQSLQKISDDQFEQVMWELESLANENMPFLSVVSCYPRPVYGLPHVPTRCLLTLCLGRIHRRYLHLTS